MGARPEEANSNPRRRKRPTLQDVAKLAGTSVITTSRAINGHSYVHDDTRRRVMQAVKKLGYRPNAMARGLVTNRSQSIGVVISDITNPFFPQVIRGIEDELIKEKYNVVLADTDGYPHRDTEALDLLLEKQVDGLILGASRAPDEELLRVIQSGVPTVLINRIPPHPSAGAVLVDARSAAKDAVRHLINYGHRRIAFFSGPEVSWSNRERLAGYKETMTEAGLMGAGDLVVPVTPPTVDGAGRCMEDLLSKANRPTAIFAFDDLIAIGAMQAALRSGLKVPGDVSVVGFDDIELAAFVSPSLTTIHQPKYEMGRQAASIMLKMLKGTATTKHRRQILPGTLVVRESCGA